MNKIYRVIISVQGEPNIAFDITLLASSVCDAISRIAEFSFFNRCGLSVDYKKLIVETAEQIGILTSTDQQLFPIGAGGAYD